MLEGHDIVCLSFVTWDDHWGTPQQFMSRLARANRVVFVDQPVSPMSFATGIRRRAAVARQFRRWRDGPRQVSPNVWAAAPPPVLPFRYQRATNAINARLLRGWLRKTAAGLGLRAPIAWNFQPSLPGVGRALEPSLSVYHVVDDFASVPHWWNAAASVRAREAECCREADVVLSTGQKLIEARRAFNPNIHFVPEGADVELFARAADPALAVAPELAAVRLPIIGYLGVIDFRLDVPLLERLAAERPEWSIVIVGPVKSDVAGFARLRALANVRVVGAQPIERLPAFIKPMDVCLIPYVLNDYTHHIFPLKLYEYMAAGKPIVATDMEEMRPYAGDEMTVARTHDEFIAAVASALASDSPQRAAARQRAARGHSWEDRVERASAHVQAALAAKHGTHPSVAAEAVLAAGGD